MAKYRPSANVRPFSVGHWPALHVVFNVFISLNTRPSDVADGPLATWTNRRLEQVVYFASS